MLGEPSMLPRIQTGVSAVCQASALTPELSPWPLIYLFVTSFIGPTIHAANVKYLSLSHHTPG